jgi:hypothetical protein
LNSQKTGEESVEPGKKRFFHKLGHSAERENVPAIVENAVGGMAAGQTSSAVKENKPQPPNA